MGTVNCSVKFPARDFHNHDKDGRTEQNCLIHKIVNRPFYGRPLISVPLTVGTLTRTDDYFQDGFKTLDIAVLRPSFHLKLVVRSEFSNIYSAALTIFYGLESLNLAMDVSRISSTSAILVVTRSTNTNSMSLFVLEYLSTDFGVSCGLRLVLTDALLTTVQVMFSGASLRVCV